MGQVGQVGKVRHSTSVLGCGAAVGLGKVGKVGKVERPFLCVKRHFGHAKVRSGAWRRPRSASRCSSVSRIRRSRAATPPADRGSIAPVVRLGGKRDGRLRKRRLRTVFAMIGYVSSRSNRAAIRTTGRAPDDGPETGLDQTFLDWVSLTV